MRAGWQVFLWLVLFASCAGAQELSTDVYPSEEELEQALGNQEIDIARFLELRELVRSGIEISQYYLIDEIPNLTYAGDTSLLSSLEREQFRPFRLPSFYRENARVQWKLSYAHRLEDDSLYRYYQSLSVRATPNLSTNLRIAKEYTGEVHLSERSLLYQDTQGVLRKVIAGNFYARFGLGGVIGHRSQLLDAPEEFSDENLLFPDYSGYNGAFIDARWHNREVRALFSLQRDSLFTAFTAASSVELFNARNRPQLILSLTSLHNRVTDAAQAIVTGSLFERYAYHSGHLAAELVAQGEETIQFGGIIISGEHSNGDIKVIYQGWSYSDSFRDITTGSLSGHVQRKTEIDKTGFFYTDRHRGQEGGTIRTSIPLSAKTHLLTNLTAALVNADTADVHFLSGITGQLSKKVADRIDYLVTQKKRVGTSSEPIHQIRLETTVTLGRLTSRQYIAARWRNSAGQLGIVLNPRYALNDGSEIEVWFSSRNAALDKTDDGYTYMFIRTAYHLFAQGIFSLKFSRRFKQRDGNSGQSMITGTLELQW